MRVLGRFARAGPALTQTGTPAAASQSRHTDQHGAKQDDGGRLRSYVNLHISGRECRTRAVLDDQVKFVGMSDIRVEKSSQRRIPETQVLRILNSPVSQGLRTVLARARDPTGSSNPGPESR